MPDVFTRHKRKAATDNIPTTTSQPEHEPEKNTGPSKHTTNPLSMISTFCRNPLDVLLFGQDTDEKILLFLRRDFITNFPWIFNSIFFALLPLWLLPLLSFSGFSIDFLPTSLKIVLISFYYLLVIGYALASFSTWFYTIGVITNKKAVDIDFHNLSSIHVGSVNLPDTSDAKYQQKGFFQSFFDFGDITITVEATKEKFVFEQTPKPAEVTDLLTDLIGES